METTPSTNKTENPLGILPVNQLLRKFAVPGIISLLVASLYNIVDQIFIGQGVGMLGNAATNVAFPLTTICNALCLMVGIGGAAAFNLSLGAKNEKHATKILGTALSTLVIIGVALCLIINLTLDNLLIAFGATADVLPYAQTYTHITAFGLPFLIFSTGSSFLIRADGSPKFSMICTVSGAVLNSILDPIFIFGLGMGMAGAALATIMGQILSASLAFSYVFRYQTVNLTPAHFIPRLSVLKSFLPLGIASFFNQAAMSIAQITLNNTLTYYGAQSIYGSEIPLAAVGVIVKVNSLFIALILGVTQGAQPILSYNYGAQKYDRVIKVYKSTVLATGCFAMVAFLTYQIFPVKITSLFGDGSELYYQFSVQYFRIYLCMSFMSFFHPLTGNFFTAIGKAKIGACVSLTRQIILLVPLIIILPRFLGIDGIMYAGPISDFLAVCIAATLSFRELRRIHRLSLAQK